MNELLNAITLTWNNIFYIFAYLGYVQQKFRNIFTDTSCEKT